MGTGQLGTRVLRHGWLWTGQPGWTIGIGHLEHAKMARTDRTGQPGQMGQKNQDSQGKKKDHKFAAAHPQD
jgi:hypothetical protein